MDSRYLQRFITKTADVVISGTTKTSETDQRESQCLRSVAKMAKIMTEKEWIALAYREGKTDMARRLVEEINQIDVYGTDEYMNGANFAIVKVLEVIEQLVGDSDARDGMP
jgi:hypothetical protein